MSYLAENKDLNYLKKLKRQLANDFQQRFPPNRVAAPIYNSLTNPNTTLGDLFADTVEVKRIKQINDVISSAITTTKLVPFSSALIAALPGAYIGGRISNILAEQSQVTAQSPETKVATLIASVIAPTIALAFLGYIAGRFISRPMVESILAKGASVQHYYPSANDK